MFSPRLLVFCFCPVAKWLSANRVSEEDVKVLCNSFTKYDLFYNGFRNANMSPVMHEAHSHNHLPAIMALKEKQKLQL